MENKSILLSSIIGGMIAAVIVGVFMLCYPKTTVRSGTVNLDSTLGEAMVDVIEDIISNDCEDSYESTCSFLGVTKNAKSINGFVENLKTAKSNLKIYKNLYVDSTGRYLEVLIDDMINIIENEKHPMHDYVIEELEDALDNKTHRYPIYNDILDDISEDTIISENCIKNSTKC